MLVWLRRARGEVRRGSEKHRRTPRYLPIPIPIPIPFASNIFRGLILNLFWNYYRRKSNHSAGDRNSSEGTSHTTTISERAPPQWVAVEAAVSLCSEIGGHSQSRKTFFRRLWQGRKDVVVAAMHIWSFAKKSARKVVGIGHR